MRLDPKRLETLRDKVKEYPVTSGIYLMKNLQEKIIYVGKAKNLRARVKSYFLNSADLTPKTRLLISHIHEIEYILTQTEVEAFLLEASLIKKHRPKYNIRLKDDKAYPYIRLSWADDFPRLYLARKVKKDGAYYFGPYTSGQAVFGTIRFLNRIFQVRDCSDAMFKIRTRPCLTHQIGRCSAPCVKLISREDYRSEVQGVKDFLGGKNKKVLRTLEKKMRQAASDEHFEVAARLRDSLESVKVILEKQSVINATSDKDQDAVGYFGDERGCLIETLHVRAGRVIGTRAHFFPMLDPTEESEDPREWLVSFLNQYYEDNFVPDELILPMDLGSDLHKLLEAVLKERAEKLVRVRFATDDNSQRLVDLAHTNAESHFAKAVSKTEEKTKGLQEIQEKLGLSEFPVRIECFDISNFQGKETVASQVVFEDGIPAKEHYRRYKIKMVQGSNDFASMQEVLVRRLKNTDLERPQLIVVDGGKGQLSVATKVLQDLDLQIPVVGLAKARTESDFQQQDVIGSEERFFVPGRSNPVIFRPASEAYQILVGIRDEAHRFAITYHRKLREATSLESELDFVVGLGEKRKRALLKKFRSTEELKMAEVEQIAEIPGMNRVLAERILLQLSEVEEITNPGIEVGSEK